MGSRQTIRILPAWLARLLAPRDTAPAELRQAKALLAAIDAGGLPLNPVRINAIARGFGLEVSRKAPVEDTVRRIREAVARAR
jgi:hypothetical protein